MPDSGTRAVRAVRVRELFAQALKAPVDGRELWLAEQTAWDESILDEVRRLLAADAPRQSHPTARTSAPAQAVDPRGPSDEAGRRIGHYRLDAAIGEGGMGRVFRAWDLALDRPAAIKLLRSDVDAHSAERLLREVQTCAQLQHPAIATFFEGGQSGDTVYLAMELVEGTTLRRRLADGPLTPSAALIVITGVLEALAHAHASGLLHRDIKPENVMVTETGHPKLLDFGIARSLPPWLHPDPPATKTATQGGTLGLPTVSGVGTPGYMSPEQLRGELLTPASDVFQVGALLFEILAGEPAFSGSTMGRIAKTLEGPPDLTPISRLEPRGLAALVARALAFDPADRFTSAAACLREVDALVDGRLHSALPDSIVVAGFVPKQFSHAPVGADADRAVDWLASALTEAIWGSLVRHGRCKVIKPSVVARALADSRSTVDCDDAIRVTLALGVRWLVTGSYGRSDDRLSVTIRVVEVSTGELVCETTVAGGLDDVLGRPARLVEPILGALNLGLPSEVSAVAQPQARTVELYQTACALWQSGARDAHARALALLDEALSLSPDYVPALTQLASSRATRYIASHDPLDLVKALDAADRAIALDPGEAAAWSWRAYALMRQRRVEEALSAFERATGLGDDSVTSYLYGTMLSSLGRFETALPHLQRTVTLEPRYGIAWLSLGWTLHSLLRDDAAEFALRQAQSLEGQPGPTFVAGVGGYLSECLRATGDLEGARREAMRGLESIERSDHTYRETIRGLCLCAFGRTALAQGDLEAARAAFSQARAQIQGRARSMAGGHVLVQALAGLSRSTRDLAPLSEAVATFDERTEYCFQHFFGCSDDVTAFELAVAARELGQTAEADRYIASARAAGSRRPPPTVSA